MAGDDRSRSDEDDERDESEDATRFRSADADDEDEATVLRGSSTSDDGSGSDADADADADEGAEPEAASGPDDPDADDEDDATRMRPSGGRVEPTELLYEQGPDGHVSAEASGEVDVRIESGEAPSTGASDDDEEPTVFRGARDDAADDDDEEPTVFRGAGDDAADEDDEEPTVFRGAGDRAAAPADDDEEATQFRGAPGAEPDADGAADDVDDVDEPTQFRVTSTQPRFDGGATVVKGADAADEDEATRFRSPPGDDDATEVNSGIGDEATQLRPGRGFSDDDPTVQGDVPGDDDPTVAGDRAAGASADPGDEDATVQAGGDDDATQQPGGGDDDSTVPGAGAKRPAARPARPAPPPAAKGETGIGTVLKGRFVLEDKLGAGGMGGVFLAVDLVKQEAQDRNPYVAVKVLNENFADHPDAFIALQRESSRTQRLSHPNIASVYDFDRDGDVAYMVMELLKGDPLDKHLKANKKGLGPEQARSVIRDISSALAYAHAQGLIHSDFKPGNIFFTEDGTAKVFDFGIARAAATGGDDAVKSGPVDPDSLEDDAPGEDKTLFDAGKLNALTPAYAAIEMFEGRDPGPQDDVYALGIVAYQCLTGKHPFDRQKAPMAEAKGMVPQRPEGVTRREWRAIRRALAFRREDRTPDAQAFLDEFFGIAGQAVKAAVITGLGAAAVVAALYFGGVIGPQTQIPSREQWVELDSQITSLRTAVQDELQDPSFAADDQFVAWEGVVQRDISQWAELASPKLEIGPFPTESAAQDLRLQAYEQAGVVLRVQTPTGAGGSWRLLAGPWPGADAEQQRTEMMARLDELGIAYEVVGDEQAIADARDAAVDVYLDEFDRRLPGGEPPRVGAVVNAGGEYIDGRPSDPSIQEELEAGAFWVADPETVAVIQDNLLRVRSAGDVLERGRERFPLDDRRADYDRAANLLAATEASWNQALRQGQANASALQQNFIAAQQSSETQKSIEQERENLYNAKVSGGEVPVFFTNDQVEGTSSHPGVYRVFRLQCQDTDRVRLALEDFPDLKPEDQRQAVTYAFDCMAAKVGNYTDEILRNRDIVRGAAEAQGIGTDLLATIERPDPCGNLGYVGAGRSAFCVDEIGNGRTAPPVVVVPGTTRGQNFAIGKFEVSVGDFNAFCAATGCEPRAGAARAPVTGVSFEQAQAYTEWLSGRTGRVYRLPTEQEWRHAAAANGSDLDPNRNCYSNIRGVIRGDELVTVGQGAPNAWGLVNHVGNAQEYARSDGGLVVVGGRHLDPLVQCTVSTVRGDEGAPDPATGFRVLREIGS